MVAIKGLTELEESLGQDQADVKKIKDHEKSIDDNTVTDDWRKDIARKVKGVFDTYEDVTKSAVAGVSKGFLEAIDTGASILDVTGEVLSGQSLFDQHGIDPGGIARRKSEFDNLNKNVKSGLSDIKDNIDNFWTPGETLPGKLTQSIAQWTSVAGPARKSLAIKNGLVKSMVAGGIADFAAFDPYEERLANILIEFDNPVFNNTFTKWLAADEDDPELEGRMKQLVEGGILGATFEAFMKLARVVKGSAKARDFLNGVVRSFSRKENIKGISQLESSIIDDIVITGEPRLGEAFEDKDIDLTTLRGLIDETDLADAETLTFTAEGIQAGNRPTVIIKMVDGKPDEILEGADVVQLMSEINRGGSITVKTIHGSTDNIIKNDFKSVEDSFKASEDAMTSVNEKITKTLKNVLSKDKWIDVSAKARDQILKIGGPLADDAIRNLDSISGATAKARLEFHKASTKIYDGLSKEDITNLDRLIAAHRNVQIDLYRKGTDKVVHPDRLSGKQYDNYITELKQKLGDKKFGDLQSRARVHFEAMRSQLNQLKDAGLIDDKLFNKIKRFDYTPTEYIDLIDPEQTFKLGGSAISIPDSGVKKFGGGRASTVNIDQRMLLSQVIIRTQSRIAKNDANLALMKFADENELNGFVSRTEFDKSTPIKVMVDGKPEKIYMSNDVVDGWLNQSPEISSYLANLIRIGSGTALVKPLATGHNPGFVLVSFPMDVNLAYLSTAEKVGFSNHLPKFFIQLAKDLKETAPDAFRRTGAFQQFINERGGMDFLTHQGRDFISTGNRGFKRLFDIPDAMSANANIDRQWEGLKSATSYLNESFEVWVRLAIRNRAIKNGLDPEEASYQARRYFDLSRGGSSAKALDNAIPYFNAFIQGFRSVGRSAKENPKAMAIKLSYLMAATASWHYWSYTTNPDAYNSIADKKKATHVNITTPFKFKDANGNLRHVYFSVKRDPVSVPLTMLTDAAMIKYMSKDNHIDDSFLDALGSSFIDVGSAIPSLQAYTRYVNNKDYWRKDIWRSKSTPMGEIDPREEFIGDGSSIGDTPEFFKQVGGTFNISPVRLQESISAVLPNNTYTNILGMGYQTMMKGLPDDFMDQHWAQISSQSPILQRVMRLTHPLEKDIEIAKDLSLPHKNESLEINRQLDIKLKKMDQGRLDINTLKQWVKSNNPKFADRLMSRIENHVQVNKAFDRFSKIENLPGKYWWVGLANERLSDAKAEVFYERWRDSDLETRNAMKRLSAAIPGFWDAQSMKKFQMLLRERGND